jgi:hypothetical protein
LRSSASEEGIVVVLMIHLLAKRTHERVPPQAEPTTAGACRNGRSRRELRKNSEN